MSLKKQVKQLKAELQRKDEQVHSLLKLSKVAKYADLQHELDMYKAECERLQQLLEEEPEPIANIEMQQLHPSESNQAHVLSQGRVLTENELEETRLQLDEANALILKLQAEIEHLKKPQSPDHKQEQQRQELQKFKTA